MSARAKAFVESWIEQYVHPMARETDNHRSRSRASAAACLQSAEVEGIPKDEIREEYGDLVPCMAGAYVRPLSGSPTAGR